MRLATTLLAAAALLAVAGPALANDGWYQDDPPDQWSFEPAMPDVIIRARVCDTGCTSAELYRGDDLVATVGWDGALVEETEGYCDPAEMELPWEEEAETWEGYPNDDWCAEYFYDEETDSVPENLDCPDNAAEYCAMFPWDCEDCDSDGAAECYGWCGQRGVIELVDACVPVPPSGGRIEYRAEADRGEDPWSRSFRVDVERVDDCQGVASPEMLPRRGCLASKAGGTNPLPLSLLMAAIGLVGLVIGRERG